MLFCLSWTLHWSSELKLEFSFSSIHVFVADKRGKIEIKKRWKKGRKERKERRKKISFVRYRVEYIIPQELLLGLDLTYKQSSWRVSAFCVCVVCCSAISWGKPFIPQNNIPHTVSALSLSLLSCMLSISQMQKLTHTPSFTRLPSNFSYYTYTYSHILS